MKLAKYVMSNSCSKSFENIQEKYPREIALLNKKAGLCDTSWECFSEKFMKFSEQLSQETSGNAGFCN